MNATDTPVRRPGRPAPLLADCIRQGPGCWEWVGYRDPDGSGRFWVGGRRISARKAVYAAFVGPVPVGKVIAATCGNPSCVRPDHLIPADHSATSRHVRKATRAGPTPDRVHPLTCSRCGSGFAGERRQKRRAERGGAVACSPKCSTGLARQHQPA